MRLPVPAEVKGVYYTDCEITAPTVNVVGETRKIAETGNFFSSMRPFCNGCITEFRTSDGQVVNNPISIKSIIMQTPYRSIEHVALQAILKHYIDDDGIEGVYYCPRCGAEHVAEVRQEDGVSIDTRDHIGNLEVNYFSIDEDSNVIHLDLAEPVEIIDKKDNSVFLEVTDLDIKIPTLEHCIAAEGKVGIRDYVKLQIAIYVEALQKINGKEVDNKFRITYGMYIFGNMKAVKKDLGYLAENINKYGINRGVQKECRKCGKVWTATVNTSNFFVSAPLTF